jgi:hypothetical protein
MQDTSTEPRGQGIRRYAGGFPGTPIDPVAEEQIRQAEDRAPEATGRGR